MPLIVEDAEWALETLNDRIQSYSAYREYYDGNHRLLFATDKFLNAFGNLFHALADNLCQPVVDAAADRLQISGFEAPAQQVDIAWELWHANRMDQRAGDVHTTALKEGDAYVIVWPNDKTNEIRFFPQHSSNVCVRYDDEDGETIEIGAKVWRVGRGKSFRYRMNLYYPDRIEKYQTKEGTDAGMPDRASAFREIDSEAETTRNPWGVVPIFHFANNTSIGEYGRSELANVIPLQDALNKAVCDMLVAMEFHALPQRWATGLQVEIDEVTGKPRAPFVPGADRIWTVGDSEVRFGQFQSADLKQFIDVQESLRAEIARVSKTPLWILLASDPPSGEAMKTAEGPFVKKVNDRQVAFGNVWEQVIQLGLRMAGQSVDPSEWETLWDSAEIRNEMIEAQTQEIKQRLGVSKRVSLQELGYTAEEIDDMEQEREVEQDAIGDAMLTALTRNQPVSTGQLSGVNGAEAE